NHPRRRTCSSPDLGRTHSRRSACLSVDTGSYTGSTGKKRKRKTIPRIQYAELMSPGSTEEDDDDPGEGG
ncbi:hypothetical protein E4U58_007390, partial [Claviceps cyperi]